MTAPPAAEPGLARSQAGQRGPAPLPLGLERGPFAVTVMAGSLLVSGLVGRTPWWVTPIVVAGLFATMTVRVSGRTMPRRFLDWMEYRDSYDARALARATLPEVREVAVAAGPCGIRRVDDTLVAMIQLAPNLDLPTVIAENSTYTEDIVPIGALVGMLDQYGIEVDIDIVATGQRVRPTGSYGMLYDQLIGSHPVVGNRLTWLVVRLDQQRNLRTLARRGPCAVVAPKALANAAHRVAMLLRGAGMAAHVLPAAYLGEATRLLHSGVNTNELHETWDCLLTPAMGRTVTSFWVDPDRMDSASLAECWAWNSEHTTLTVNLTKGQRSGAEMRALVRYIGPPVDSPPFPQLRRLTGRQSEALLASMPTSTTASELGIWAAEVDADTVEELMIPIGPSGQILGTISGRPRHTLAMPLFDPVRYQPRRRIIDVHALLPVAQQLVLRAAVVGAEVEIHTNRPQRWQQLIDGIADPRSLRLVGQHPAADATIAVFDNIPASTTGAQTTILVSEPGTAADPSANLSITQVSATAVNIGIPMHTVRVELIEPVGETRYFDPGPPPPPPSGPPEPPAPPPPPPPSGPPRRTMSAGILAPESGAPPPVPGPRTEPEPPQSAPYRVSPPSGR